MMSDSSLVRMKARRAAGLERIQAAVPDCFFLDDLVLGHDDHADCAGYHRNLEIIQNVWDFRWDLFQRPK